MLLENIYLHRALFILYMHFTYSPIHFTYKTYFITTYVSIRCHPVDEQDIAADICSRRVELEHVAMISGDSPGLVLGTKNRV